MKYYVGNITPEKDVVFVFGSNPLGINGNPKKRTGGAALVAQEQFGVRPGEKMVNRMSNSGRAYGIVTVLAPGKKCSLTLFEISDNVRKFYRTAKEHPELRFCVAYRNIDKPSLCGYTGRELMRAFENAGKAPDNVYFSHEWHFAGFGDTLF